jgi:hypothetical protein
MWQVFLFERRGRKGDAEAQRRMEEWGYEELGVRITLELMRRYVPFWMGGAWKLMRRPRGLLVRRR